MVTTTSIRVRGWHARPTGARANAAPANSFEALPFFVGAVVISHQLGAGQAVLDVLAVTFIVLRLVYLMLYLAGQANARSAVWTLAFFVNVGILFCGYRRASATVRADAAGFLPPGPAL